MKEEMKKLEGKSRVRFSLNQETIRKTQRLRSSPFHLSIPSLLGLLVEKQNDYK